MTSHLVPAVDAALQDCDRIKTLMVFDEGFRGFDLVADWKETALALRHWDGFERMALVTDLSWWRQALRALALVTPCPVRLFAADQLEDARRWLGEALGTIHLDQTAELVTIAMIGQLDADVYRRIDDDLANVFSHQQPVRLLLDLRLQGSTQSCGGDRLSTLAACSLSTASSWLTPGSGCARPQQCD